MKNLYMASFLKRVMKNIEERGGLLRSRQVSALIEETAKELYRISNMKPLAKEVGDTIINRFRDIENDLDNLKSSGKEVKSEGKSTVARLRLLENELDDISSQVHHIISDIEEEEEVCE